MHARPGVTVRNRARLRVEVDDPFVSTTAAAPDLLRLLAVPILGWAAWRDVETRRVPSRTWWPLLLLGLALLLWEGWRVHAVGGPQFRLYILRAGLSVGLLVPAAHLFWRLGAFGGADRKALVALAVLFPTYPTFVVADITLPLVAAVVGVFSLTILSNTVVLGLGYPFWLVAANALDRELSPAMTVGRRLDWTAIESTHGRLLETGDGFTLGGLDLDALRMYLRWRETSLAELRADPAVTRDPASLPDTPGPVGDGAVRSSPASTEAVPAPAVDGGPGHGGGSDNERSTAGEDPWGAAAFLDDVGSAYGTTPESLREALDLLVTADRVWVSPGIPFLVPMFLGLLVALTFGDVLYAVLVAVGLL